MKKMLTLIVLLFATPLAYAQDPLPNPLLQPIKKDIKAPGAFKPLLTGSPKVFLPPILDHDLPEPDKNHPISIPSEVKVSVGRLNKVTVKALGPVTWIVYPGMGDKLDCDTSSDKSITFVPLADGVYFIGATTVVLDEASKTSYVSDPVWMVIRAGAPPIPPGPGPGPGPGPTPSPAPIPVDGYRVLIVYDEATLNQLPVDQKEILFAQEVRSYINKNCVKGPDGKTSEGRIWQKSVDTKNESDLWQKAFARPRTSLPWIVISNGRTGYEGPLPATIADTVKLMEDWRAK